jgi:hypothetical protein
VTEWLFADTSTKAKYRRPTLGPAIEAPANGSVAQLLSG